MGEKRKNLCRILSAFILCIALASAIRMTMPPNEEPAVPAMVYLDPGHGGFDFGAVGHLAGGGRLLEKELVLHVAQDCATRLRAAGVEVLLSRENDERLTYTTAPDEVRARRAAAGEAGVDLVLSLHANAYAGQGRAYGPRVYYNPESEPSKQAAERIAAAISQHTGSLCGRECRLVADGSYYILADPALPAVLIELGFLSDGQECALLADEGYQAKLAEAICAGLLGEET